MTQSEVPSSGGVGTVWQSDSEVAGGVSALTFSRDGSLLAASCGSSEIRVMDVETGSEKGILKGHTAGVSDVSWSPGMSPHILCSASDDYTLRLWDLRVDGRQDIQTLTGHTNWVMCCRFSPASNIIASGSYDESVHLWDVRSGKSIKHLPAHSDPVTAVDICCDGTLLITSSYDGLIRVWDAVTGQCVRTIIGKDDGNNIPVGHVEFGPNGRYFMAATFDSTLRLWEAASGKCFRTLSGAVNERFCLSSKFGATKSSASDWYVSGSEDGQMIVWDVQTMNVLHREKVCDSALLALDTHPTRNLVAIGGVEKTSGLRVYRLEMPS